MTKVFSPLDQQLAIFERTCSQAVAKLAVELCGRLTPVETEAILKQLGGIAFSDTSVWRRVQTWGAKLKALEELRQAAATALPQRGTVGPGAVPLSKKMGVGMDGVLIPLRQEGYTEVKVGCVFDIEPHPEKEPATEKVVERAHAVNLTYTAVLGGPDRFGKAIWAEAERRQFPDVIDNLLIADAAQWIWSTVVPEPFSTSRPAVDWDPATEHLHTVAHLVHGEGTAEAKRWVKAMEHPLAQGHPWRVVETIQDLAHAHPMLAEKLQTEAGYFQKNQRRMHYLELREDGFPIGSGMVESGCKQLRARFTGAGMRWSRPGAEHLIPIRTALLSDRFDEMWKAVYKSPSN